jgi:quercetin dioxygenase-like cupin family protein
MFFALLARMRRPRSLIAATCLTVVLGAGQGAAQPRPSTARVALKQALPALDGTRLSVQLVDVIYEPGGANPSHQHPCPVVGYVLEGALRMQIEGQPEVIYRAGDTFVERPTDVHRVSANASDTARARFLAYFTCDRDVPQLSIPTQPLGE